MKKRGILALGIAVGMISSIGIQSFAGDAIQRVTASIDKTFQLTVNEEKKVLPEGYEILVYQDRTYLPIRALGEMIGCEIDWDNATKTVKVVTPKTDQNPSDPSNSDQRNYKKLPQTYESEGYRLTLTSYGSNIGTDKLSKIYFRLTNTDTNVVRILPAKIVIEANDKNFTHYTTDVDFEKQDSKLYSTYISEENGEMESYITLPESIKSAEKIHIEIPVATDTYRGQTVDTVEFDIDTEAK